ncbi:MAG: Quercetinase C-terminal cupin domain, partial [Bacteroidota bacterium]
VDDITLGKRDAVGIYDTDSFSVTATEDAELLAIEVPMD